MSKAKKETTKKKVKMSLGWKMVLMSGISLVIMAIVLTSYSAITMRKGSNGCVTVSGKRSQSGI